MADFLNLVKSRSSCRDFIPRKKVEEEKLQLILEAGRLAPSARNLQPWRFILVESADALARVKKAYNKPWFDDVSMVLAVVGIWEEKWVRLFDHYTSLETDLAIAMDHMVLASADLGVATCWIGNFEPEVLKGALDLHDHNVVYAITPLGYAKASEGKPKIRKALNEVLRRI